MLLQEAVKDASGQRFAGEMKAEPLLVSRVLQVSLKRRRAERGGQTTCHASISEARVEQN